MYQPQISHYPSVRRTRALNHIGRLCHNEPLLKEFFEEELEELEVVQKHRIQNDSGVGDKVMLKRWFHGDHSEQGGVLGAGSGKRLNISPAADAGVDNKKLLVKDVGPREFEVRVMERKKS